MNHSETDISLVEKYFDEELSDFEKENFTHRLANDPNFKSFVDEEKALIRAIRYQGLKCDLSFLKSLEVEIHKSTKKTESASKIWYYAAAALVGILIMAKIFLFPPAETPDQLFEAYFKPYPNVFEPTVRGTDVTNTRKEAFQAYEQGDYQTAVTLFKEILQTSNEPGVLLLLGNANLILGNVDEATENFITLSNDFDELDLQAKWFLGLCYLKGGDVEHMTKILQELGETEISYAEKAKELLEKIN